MLEPVSACVALTITGVLIVGACSSAVHAAKSSKGRRRQRLQAQRIQARQLQVPPRKPSGGPKAPVPSRVDLAEQLQAHPEHVQQLVEQQDESSVDSSEDFGSLLSSSEDSSEAEDPRLWPEYELDSAARSHWLGIVATNAAERRRARLQEKLTQQLEEEEHQRHRERGLRRVRSWLRGLGSPPGKANLTRPGSELPCDSDEPVEAVMPELYRT